MLNSPFAARDAAHLEAVEQEREQRTFEDFHEGIMYEWEQSVGSEVRRLRTDAFRTALQSERLLKNIDDSELRKPSHIFWQFGPEYSAYDPTTHATSYGQSEVLVRRIDLFAKDHVKLRKLVEGCQSARGVTGVLHAVRRGRESTIQKFDDLSARIDVSYTVPSNPEQPLGSSESVDTSGHGVSIEVPSVGAERDAFRLQLINHAEREQQLDWMRQQADTEGFNARSLEIILGLGANYTSLVPGGVGESRIHSVSSILDSMHAWMDWRYMVQEQLGLEKRIDTPTVENAIQLVSRAVSLLPSYVDFGRYKATADRLMVEKMDKLTRVERFLVHGPTQDELETAELSDR